MAQLANLLNNNFFSEVLGFLFASVTYGVAVKLKVAEWKAGAIAASTVIALFVVKVLFTPATLWSAFVAVMPVGALVVWMVLVTYALRRAWRREQSAITSSDQEWSANPWQFLSVEPTICSINIGIRAVSLRIKVTNQYNKERYVHVSTSVALYRHGSDQPLCTIPLPVAEAVVGPNTNALATPIWQAILSTDDAQQIATFYKIDRKIKVQLAQTTITTIVNLTGVPKTLTTNALPLGTPVDVENFFE
jgi:hypothetical protein